MILSGRCANRDEPYPSHARLLDVSDFVFHVRHFSYRDSPRRDSPSEVALVCRGLMKLSPSLGCESLFFVPGK